LLTLEAPAVGANELRTLPDVSRDSVFSLL